MTAVFVGIGSNIRPHEHVPQALKQLETAFGTLQVSASYRCRAIGFNGADFVNLVVAFDTDYDVHDLQARLRAIENACGRDRSAKDASRTMDLDLLLYGDTVLDTDGIRLPRADILDYSFVLRPLAELAPDRRHPVDGRSYAELWADFDTDAQPLTPIDLDAG